MTPRSRYQRFWLSVAEGRGGAVLGTDPAVAPLWPTHSAVEREPSTVHRLSRLFDKGFSRGREYRAEVSAFRLALCTRFEGGALVASLGLFPRAQKLSTGWAPCRATSNTIDVPQRPAPPFLVHVFPSAGWLAPTEYASGRPFPISRASRKSHPSWDWMFAARPRVPSSLTPPKRRSWQEQPHDPEELTNHSGASVVLKRKSTVGTGAVSRS